MITGGGRQQRGQLRAPDEIRVSAAGRRASGEGVQGQEVQPQ